MTSRLILLMCGIALVAGCGRLAEVGRAPEMTEAKDGAEHYAISHPAIPETAFAERPTDAASLWTGNRQSLLGDHRATRRGDILTVVIEINDKAEISNSTGRSRSGSETLSMPQLFGLPQRLDEKLPEGASSASAVSLDQSSKSGGQGSVRRNEKLTLRVAATILDVMPNGVLAIKGAQEVRVNYELRELLVSGYVRPQDVSRQNEVTYDKIASARISYGGRGQITDVQQPRYGQQVLDAVLPF